MSLSPIPASGRHLVALPLNKSLARRYTQAIDRCTAIVKIRLSGRPPADRPVITESWGDAFSNIRAP